MITHPMQSKQRPLIPTRAIESFADAIKTAIEDGHNGIQVQGRARDGKTRATIYLEKHPSWLDEPTHMFRITMLRRKNHSDTSFYKVIQLQVGLVQHHQSSAANRIQQIVDCIIGECIAMGCHRSILFIDEAQQLSDDDFEYLTNLDNAMTEDGYELFCVFIHQTDDAKAEKRRKLSKLVEQLPPHVTGRYFLAEHVFSGLRGISDLQHALDQYDSRLRFEGKSFTEYFAGQAFSKGWRLASHAKDFVTAISNIRKRSQLKGPADLSMKIFAVAVYRLLVRVAPDNPSFSGFDEKLIEQVLLDSGYLALEKARQRQVAA
ncbi:hypothetical protein [Dyella sp.]|uniref:hypothetical protein n=1 Tax=Dyella sp. TaxID=1869338 RepID=UPI002851BFA4|nr:hypothetical protein [Dyella sp.]MDR3443716.1 hypothetical protein [Dyella sp.]